MLVMCVIAVAIDAGGISWVINQQTEGKILNESQTNYLVDFSKGVKDYKLMGKPEDYSKVLVKKTECVKEQ